MSGNVLQPGGLCSGLSAGSLVHVSARVLLADRETYRYFVEGVEWYYVSRTPRRGGFGEVVRVVPDLSGRYR